MRNKGSIITIVDEKFLNRYLEFRSRTKIKKDSFFSLKEKLCNLFQNELHLSRELNKLVEEHYKSFWGPLFIATELATLDIYYTTMRGNKKQRTIYFTCWTWEKLRFGYLDDTIRRVIENHIKKLNDSTENFYKKHIDLKWNLGNYNKTLISYI
ncbi:hypothetical protein [Anaeromicrobium sediminis]|uniref:Uncharacterized protein n=1 Tax=Anaeromicrobium sediminis TaxID=1478221 RepID=A0A267MPV5_9FIRM|nr:hypothetical protein [Anaeromicrobium sediminis]PAB60813.1 hypothetical protein CCE28_04570 [Anaeromicrobium sediminis]